MVARLKVDTTIGTSRNEGPHLGELITTSWRPAFPNKANQARPRRDAAEGKGKLGNKAIIRMGDGTSHGGIVVEGHQFLVIHGKPAAGVGHRVHCPKCSGSPVIVEGAMNASMMGISIAAEGMRRPISKRSPLPRAAAMTSNMARSRARKTTLGDSRAP